MPTMKHIRMMWMSCWLLACVVTVTGGAGMSAAQAEEMAVAATSNLDFAIKELIPEYAKQSGHHVKLYLGSSGNFYAQLQQGRLLICIFRQTLPIRRSWRKPVHSAGHPASLCSGSDRRCGLQRVHPRCVEGNDGVAWTDHKENRHCNPKHAPYGRAAVAAMEHEQVYADVKDRLVLGENIRKRRHSSDSGACDVGVVALSLAMAPAMKSAGDLGRFPRTTIHHWNRAR